MSAGSVGVRYVMGKRGAGLECFCLSSISYFESGYIYIYIYVYSLFESSYFDIIAIP